ncbi:hypothetical protein DERF_005826 [Dermatophagoides farinae]|uniref:Uncharacterized protein n=1 Tax=Dermatophagoides farinae TaxID=6954 RepID=A0A922LBN6_DERFA|nr:hypothetical protein DERF_005826 [Dermatophagoides farinae]
MKHQTIHCLMAMLFITIITIVIDQSNTSPITITKILAGKKKFKTYSLGISFLPTLVKVKPNKLHLTIRQNQYIRPKKFKMDGSLPLKVPTILMAKRNPYAEPPKDVVINADIALGPEKYSKKPSYGYASSSAAAASEPEPIIETIPSSQPQQPLPPLEIPIPFPMENPPPTSIQFDDNIGQPRLPPPIDSNEQKLLLQHAAESNQQVSGYDQNELMLAPPPAPLPPPPVLRPLPSKFPMEIPHLPLPKEYKFQGMSKQSSKDKPLEIRRSSNLPEPYHHHLINRQESESSLLPPPPPPMFFPPPPHLPPPLLMAPIHQPPMFQHAPVSPSTIRRIPWGPRRPDQHMFHDSSPVSSASQPQSSISRQMAIELTDVTSIDDPIGSTNQQQIEKEHRPMKINIGEHYDPNMIYVDEQTIPSQSQIDELTNNPVPMHDEDMDDDSFGSNPVGQPTKGFIPELITGDDLSDTAMAESSIQYVKKYGGKNKYYKKKKYGNDGPDDFRIEFNLSGPHGGPMVPYGYGDDQDQLNKQLNQIQQYIPVGPHAKSIYNYYLRHTFTEPIRTWPYSYARVKKLKKLIPERQRKPMPPLHLM